MQGASHPASVACNLPRIGGLGAGGLACAILTLGWLHTIEFDVVAGWRVDGAAAAQHLFGISLLAPITLCVSGASLIRHVDAVRWPPAWGILLFASSALIPSSAVAALALGLFGGWMAVRSSGAARFAAGCIAGLGVCALWASVGQRVLSTPLLTADASAAQWVLGWFVPGVMRDGNVLTTLAGHRVVILLACATSTALPVILLASTAIAVRDARRLTARWVGAIALLSATFIFLNIVRLAWLSRSASDDALVHGPLGQNVFDALQIVLVLTAARLGGSRDEPARSRPEIVARPGNPRLGSATIRYGLPACLLAGLALTGMRYSQPDENLADETAGAVASLLASEGWQFAGTRELIASTGYIVLDFRHPGCKAPVSVALLPGSTEAVAAALDALGPEIGFLHAGKLGPVPPDGMMLDQLSIGALLRRLRLGERAMPLLAIAPAPRPEAGLCAPPQAAAWERLRPEVAAF